MDLRTEALAISARAISTRAAADLAVAADLAGVGARPGMPPPIPTAASSSSQRRSLLTRRLQQQDQDSDEDLGSSDEEEQMMRYMDEFSANHAHFRSVMAEDHIRAAQVLRGQLSNRRVASKQALSQLQSVDLDSLAQSERSRSSLLFASSACVSCVLTCP
jgi:hypothetical protein